MLILTLLLACQGNADPTPPGTPTSLEWSAPDTEGDNIVGTLTGEAEGRDGVLLPTQIWFPASSASPNPYLYEGGLNLSGIARYDAVPACDVPLPVVMFSHGNSGLNIQSIFYTEYLASHGYLVVAPAHTGNTALDMSVPREEMAIRRPLDIRAAFDHLLERSATPGDPLEGCADPDAGYAITGHSFGGYTTFAVAGARFDVDAYDSVCATSDDWLCGAQDVYREWFPNGDGDLSDDRVWAAVPLAPAAHGSLGAGMGDITVPTAILCGQDDTLTPYAWECDPVFDLLDASPSTVLLGVAKAGHFSFTNFCLPGFNGCGPDDRELNEVYALVNTTATAFLDVARGEARSASYLPPALASGDLWRSTP